MTFKSIIEAISHPIQMVEEGQVYLILLPVYVSLLVGERICHAITQSIKWDNKDSLANISITIAQLLIDLFVGFLFPIAILIFLYQFRLFEIPMNWWGWILVFVLYDFTWYIDHYIAHRTGLFWALHSVHHSSKEYNTTVASRGSLLETFGARPLFYLLPIFGVSPIQFILIKLVTNVWGIAQHTRLVGKLGILDLIFATPSNHRVHHGSDVHYLDKNYGEVLILWDRLCGTFARETHEPNYGLTKNIETYNPLMIQVAGIRWLSAQIKTANKWQDKLAYLYQPPGWRHDGKGETTRDLRNISK